MKEQSNVCVTTQVIYWSLTSDPLLVSDWHSYDFWRWREWPSRPNDTEDVKGRKKRVNTRSSETNGREERILCNILMLSASYLYIKRRVKAALNPSVHLIPAFFSSESRLILFLWRSSLASSCVPNDVFLSLSHSLTMLQSSWADGGHRMVSCKRIFRGNNNYFHVRSRGERKVLNTCAWRGWVDSFFPVSIPVSLPSSFARFALTCKSMSLSFAVSPLSILFPTIHWFDTLLPDDNEIEKEKRGEICVSRTNLFTLRLSVFLLFVR